MKYIKTEIENNRINFYFNEMLLGYSYKETDGFYVFTFEIHQGFWSSYVLREIADILDDLNKEWNNKINQYFKENPPFDNNKEQLGDWLKKN